MSRKQMRRSRGYVVVNPSKAIFPIVGGSGPAPVNTTLPGISGSAQEGQILTVSNGTWTNSPTSYTYQWKRAGAAIAGSVNATRTLTSADIGAAITCTVTAANANGSTGATSAATAAVIAATVAVPVNSVAPAVTGNTSIGSLLTTNNGTWSGSPTGYTYAWRRDGVDISGATASTYTLVTADAGHSITSRVYATNAGGTAGATSNAIAAVGALTIAFANPTVSIPEGNTGTTTVTSVINVVRNGVTGALTINLTYGGTATNGVDYATAPTSLTIGAGVSTGSFDILINGDTTVEPDETIVISAVEPTSGATASKTITVTNDDAAGYTFANAEAAAYVARMTTTPSDAWKALYDGFIGKMEGGNSYGLNLLSGLFDKFHLRGAHNAQAGLLDLMGGASSTLSTNPPLFSPGYGFTSNGIDSYVEWGGWTPSVGTLFQLNSASFGFHNRNPDQKANSTPQAGNIGGGTPTLYLQTRDATPKVSFRMNSAAISGPTGITDGSGHWMIQRTSATTVQVFRNGAQLGADITAASTSRSASVIREGNAFSTVNQDQLLCSYAAGVFVGNQFPALNECMEWYKTNLASVLPAAWTALVPNPTGSGDATIRAAAKTVMAAYTNRVSLPDATPTSVASKGFTCTGWSRLGDGTYVVSAFGRNVQGDASSTFQPYLIHLAADRFTVLGSINLVALGLPVAGLQGNCIDTSDNTIWLMLNDNTIGHIANNFTSPTLIGSFTGPVGGNAIGYDSKRDKLVVGSSVLVYLNKDGTSAGLPSLSASVPYVDQICYRADLDAFMVTGGPNGSDGILSLVGWLQNYGAMRFARLDVMTGVTAVEGIATDWTWCGDFWFHGGTGAIANSSGQLVAAY